MDTSEADCRFLEPVTHALPLLQRALGPELIFTGLQSLYVVNGTALGADVADYFGLVLWGLSSDIAAKTLGNLPALAKK